MDKSNFRTVSKTGRESQAGRKPAEAHGSRGGCGGPRGAAAMQDIAFMECCRQERSAQLKFYYPEMFEAKKIKWDAGPLTS